MSGKPQAGSLPWVLAIARLLVVFHWGHLSCRAGDLLPGPLATLRGTVIDAETGLPTACTVVITDSGGRTITKSDAFAPGFRCLGHFSEQLPAGRTRLKIVRGIESQVEERVLALAAGSEVDVRISLRRVANLRRRGWYAGDSHVHMIHGEKAIPVDFDTVALAAQAEDLQYLSLAQAWTLDSPTPEALEARLAERSTAACVLTWNLEAPKNYYRGDAGRCLGHCWTLGLNGRTATGADVIRLLLQASAHDYESEKPTFANFESHQLIRAQGGAVFYTHPARWWMGSWGGQGGYAKQERMRISNLAVELPLDTLLGPTFDGLDVLTGAGEHAANALAFELWCLLLNHGYRVAATGSSDACFDRRGGAMPGTARTYTWLDEPFSLEAVTRATARGRTVATSGPLLLVAVDGQPPGSAFAADGTSRLLTIEAWACGSDLQGLSRLEVLRNGKVVQTHPFAPLMSSVTTNLTLTENETAWYCVRLYGSDSQRQRAISGAFFFDRTPYHPLAPVPAVVRAKLVDANAGKVVVGTVTEVFYEAVVAREGRRHALASGEGTITIPGTARLRADADGYQSVTLSPVVDHPALLQFVTSLQAEDLVKWATFERIRDMMGRMELTFLMRPKIR